MIGDLINHLFGDEHLSEDPPSLFHCLSNGPKSFEDVFTDTPTSVLVPEDVSAEVPAPITKIASKSNGSTDQVLETLSADGSASTFQRTLQNLVSSVNDLNENPFLALCLEAGLSVPPRQPTVNPHSTLLWHSRLFSALDNPSALAAEMPLVPTPADVNVRKRKRCEDAGTVTFADHSNHQRAFRDIDTSLNANNNEEIPLEEDSNACNEAKYVAGSSWTSY